MRSLLLSNLILVLLFPSCTTDKPNRSDVTTNNSQNSNDDESQAVLSSFYGNITHGDLISAEARGTAEVTEDGVFTLATEFGSLTGRASLVQENGTSYHSVFVDINSGTEVFNGNSTVYGRLYTDRIRLTSPYDNTVIEGELLSLDAMNKAWEDERQKATIAFTNLHSCEATVTLLGHESFGPIEKHWDEDAWCSDAYPWNSEAFVNRPDFGEDVDDKSSSIVCADFTLENWNNGSAVEVSNCYAATYFLNKETTYDYVVEWENGEIEVGTVGPLAGGRRADICLTNTGPECPDTIPGTITDWDIQIDFAESVLPGQGLPPIIATDFDGELPPIWYRGGNINIGRLSAEPPNGSNFAIDITFKSGEIANGTFPLMNAWDYDDAPFDIYTSYEGESYWNYLAGVTIGDGGSVTISDYDPADGAITITFNDLKFAELGGWDPKTLKYSGFVSGFMEER